MLNIISCAYWPSAFPFWKNDYSGLLPIFNCFFFKWCVVILAFYFKWRINFPKEDIHIALATHQACSAYQLIHSSQQTYKQVGIAITLNIWHYRKVENFVKVEELICEHRASLSWVWAPNHCPEWGLPWFSVPNMKSFYRSGANSDWSTHQPMTQIALFSLH